MFDTTSPGNVAGTFTDGNVATGQRPTSLRARDLQRIYNELKTLVISSGLSLSDLDDTQVTQAVRTLISDRRNVLDNGDFQVHQRAGGVAFTAAGFAGVDRWRVNPGTGGSPSCNVDRANFSFGVPLVPGRPQYYLRWDQTVLASSAAPHLTQRVESVATLAGLEVVFSFFARANVVGGGYPSTFNVTPILRQNFGTGGSPSADVVLTNPVHAITGTWTRFQSAFTLPAVDAKTLGTSEAFLEAKLQMPTGTKFELQLADVQLEIGPTASRFERLLLDQQLRRCQRYYERSAGLGGTVTTAGQLAGEESGTDFVGGQIVYAVAKRGTQLPVVRFYSPATGASAGSLGSVRWNGADVAVTAIVAGSGTEQQLQGGYPRVGSAQALSKVSCLWTAEAEIGV